MNSSFSLLATGAIGFAVGCLVVGSWHALASGSDSSESKQQETRLVSIASQALRSPPEPRNVHDATACPPPVAQSGEQVNTAPVRQLDALLNEIIAPPGAQAPDPFSQALNLLQSSPADRAELMARYSRETNKMARSRLRMLLMNLQSEDVIEFASNLATNSDPAKRVEGYTLLRLSQEGSASAREAILKAVETEQDPYALSEAVASLMPGESPIPDEAAPIIDQMKRLIQHTSPQVRAESMIALSRWDRGIDTEDLIYNGLIDKNESIRSAALTVLAENGTRSDRVKTALLGVSRDDTAGASTRWVAADALGAFNLSQEEHSSLLALRDGLPPVRSFDNRGN